MSRATAGDGVGATLASATTVTRTPATRTVHLRIPARVRRVLLRAGVRTISARLTVLAVTTGGPTVQATRTVHVRL